MVSRRRTLPFLVAVETDPLRYHGEEALRPQPLDSAAAEQFVAHIGADLGALFPRIGRVSLGLTGALYDQAQILQPGWPVFRAMSDVFKRRQRSANRSDQTSAVPADAPSLMSVGTSQGHMPVADLTPVADLPPGVLQLIPLQLSGDPADLAFFEEQMESRFMEEGQLSPQSARALEGAFAVTSAHARFLTLTDLMAMLKLQLEHFGFAVLWELLDAALEESSATGPLSGNLGQQFHWDGQRVTAEFETFDYWANEGAGREVDTASLGEVYVAWTREYRQILVTLAAHGVDVAQHFAGHGTGLKTQGSPENTAQNRPPLNGLYFIEDAGPSGDAVPAITEHGGEAMGTVAVTVVHDGQLHHYYPLQAEGSNQIHTDLARLGVAHQGLSYPGCVCFDPDTRRLTADCNV